jgi:transcriptional regulator with XRE-family HTH domain
MRKPINDLTKDPVVLRIIHELNTQGKTGKELEKELGLSNGTFAKWKYEDRKSYIKYMVQIADFLNVTVEYLQGMPDKPKRDIELTDVEVRLIELFRKMGSGERKCMLQSAEYFANSSDLRKYRIENEDGDGGQNELPPFS